MEPREQLKADVFGTITRVGDTVVRDTGPARPWARSLARSPESKALRATIERLTGTKMEPPAAPGNDAPAPDTDGESPSEPPPAPTSTGS